METLTNVIVPGCNDETHKGDYGKILLIDGSANLGGVIMLAAHVCLFNESGLITVATHPIDHATIHPRCPKAMVIGINDIKMLTKTTENIDNILIGPGLGVDLGGNNAVTFLLWNTQPRQSLTVDGDAITIFCKFKFDIPTYRVISTPYQKERERLSGTPIEEQMYEGVREVVDKLGTIVALKKHDIEVLFKDKEYKLPIGTPTTATSGMSNTLADMITSFVGQFNNLQDAVTSVTYTHGYIGEKLSEKMYVVPLSKLTDQIPYVMKELGR